MHFKIYHVHKGDQDLRIQLFSTALFNLWKSGSRTYWDPADRNDKPVARSGKGGGGGGGGGSKKKCGPKVGVGHQKGEGAGWGCAPSRASRAEAFENIDLATQKN